MAQLTKFPDAQRDQMSKLNLFPCYQWLAQTLWNFLTTQFSTTGDVTITTAGKGLVISNAAGTISKRVILNDAGTDIEII